MARPGWIERMLLCVLGLPLAGLTLLTAERAAQPATDLAPQADKVARDVLAATGVPSASIAIVKDGRLVYAQAYGNARLSPAVPATPSMRYSIGSISKQFTSSAVLWLQEQRKLSLDDPVGKYVAGLTRGDEVTIRQVLSHTSGYQDYWPQDYVPPFMLTPIDAQRILDRWARRPLDFEPGTEWQYSNTNYVIAGLIVEKTSGMPLWQLLAQKIFTPLGMTSVTNIDERGLPASDPTGYFRYALGPARPAPKEGPGWLFAAGEIAMTASDLAKWDMSMIKRTVLAPASYQELATEVRLKNGLGTSYGLGVHVGAVSGHREIEHNGEVSGFTAENIVLPDDNAAVIVLTNQDAASAASQIGQGLLPLLLARDAAADAPRNALVKRIFDDLRQGRIDRSLFSDNANAYFTEQALADYAAGLAPLGPYQAITPTGVRSRGGMIYRGYVVRYPGKSLALSIFELPDGKFEQFLVEAR
ncbi:MAG TPA: serine hydrolase domain-containing protein [Vicinamibacterales bacterium]|nr:serine hydrolase domain-containing protein [Vicinamibacterales bacterium]